MRWTTPTGIAEAGYQARRAARAPKGVVGPAGVPIPPATATYRLTMDGGVLAGIILGAYAAFVAEQLPDRARRLAAETLAADLAGRFPIADMAVLKRYGKTVATDRISIALEDPRGAYQRPEHLALPYRRDLPDRAAWYSLHRHATIQPLPVECLLFAKNIVSVREAEVSEFKGAVLWPSLFKAREHRAPLWSEIEAAWPRLGAWMAAQREAAR